MSIINSKKLPMKGLLKLDCTKAILSLRSTPLIRVINIAFKVTSNKLISYRVKSYRFLRAIKINSLLRYKDFICIIKIS